jgi:hypothetical protein
MFLSDGSILEFKKVPLSFGFVKETMTGNSFPYIYYAFVEHRGQTTGA